MRQLTSKFGTYRLAKHEKATGEGVMDLINFGNFEITKLATLVKLGSPDIQMEEEEKVYDKIDRYLASDESHSVISAFITAVEEMNNDLKILPKDALEHMKKSIDEAMSNSVELIKNNSLLDVEGSKEEETKDTNKIIELPKQD